MKGHRPATYQDVLDAPPNMVAEIVRGALHLQPRPAPRHAHAHSILQVELGGPFSRGRGGPGGWRILIEPELHLGDDVLVPDLGGWRLERMPALPDTAWFELVPDWVCEVLSPGTRRIDLTDKRAIYGEAGRRAPLAGRPAGADARGVRARGRPLGADREPQGRCRGARRAVRGGGLSARRALGGLMAVINRIAEFEPELRAWRRHLHTIPELDFDLFDTAAFVAARLREIGVDEVHEGIAKTGIVALIRGREPGPVVGLRADMDALPIDEAVDRPWKSTRPGRMHACGHDGHTTILLGAARYLAETRNFAGTVALIFQPSEEMSGGGRVMVEEGMMERFGIGRVFGLHNEPGRRLGEIGLSGRAAAGGGRRLPGPADRARRACGLSAGLRRPGAGGARRSGRR